MEYNQLLKRVQLLKANPKLADSLPQSDFLELMAQFIGAFNSLKASIEQNKLRGEKGEDGKTPRPDVDYLSKQTAIRALNDTLDDFETKLNASISSIEKKVDTKLSGLRDGKDAEVTDELKKEIAELAYELISLPNFATLITQETEAIRNGLELLPEGEKLAQSAIEGLVEDLQKIREAIVQKSGGGGGLSRNAVISLIAQYAGTGSDSNYTQAFTGTDTVVVTHNLNKYPSPIIFDSAGDEIEGDIRHNSLNQLTVTFNTSNTGTVTCN